MCVFIHLGVLDVRIWYPNLITNNVQLNYTCTSFNSTTDTHSHKLTHKKTKFNNISITVSAFSPELSPNTVTAQLYTTDKLPFMTLLLYEDTLELPIPYNQTLLLCMNITLTHA